MNDNPWLSVNAIAAYIALFGSVFGAAFVVILTDWRKRRTDRMMALQTRAQTASEREVEARTEFMELQGRRIGELETSLDQIRKSELELIGRFRDDQRALETSYRHLIAALVTYSAILKVKLEKCGVTEIPDFTGWDAFMREGGTVADSWKNPDMRE